MLGINFWTKIYFFRIRLFKKIAVKKMLKSAFSFEEYYYIYRISFCFEDKDICVKKMFLHADPYSFRDFEILYFISYSKEDKEKAFLTMSIIARKLSELVMLYDIAEDTETKKRILKKIENSSSPKRDYILSTILADVIN